MVQYRTNRNLAMALPLLVGADGLVDPDCHRDVQEDLALVRRHVELVEHAVERLLLAGGQDQAIRLEIPAYYLNPNAGASAEAIVSTSEKSAHGESTERSGKRSTFAQRTCKEKNTLPSLGFQIAHCSSSEISCRSQPSPNDARMPS
jgi:hypothetical protein